MSGVDCDAQMMSSIQEHAELYNRHQRRHGFGDIFEHVDVPLLMKKLNLQDSQYSPRISTSCSSCPMICEDHVRRCPASINDIPTSSATCLKTEDSVQSYSCDCLEDSDSQKDKDEIHSCLWRHTGMHQGHTDESDMVCDVCDGNDGMVKFPATENRSAESLFFPSTDPTQMDKNTNSSSDSEDAGSNTYWKSGSETEKVGADPADNSHAVLAIRAEVCAKRSLIF
ncbi:hypothetical protein ACOMHN_029173 [Nucella lapillus]